MPADVHGRPRTVTRNHLRRNIGVVYGTPEREAEVEILHGSASTSPARSSTWLRPPAVETSGAFYSHNGERIAQGREKACAYVTRET
jgi:hypothetical protein